MSAIAWLTTYAVHSTLLLGAAWIATRRMQAPRLRELVWKGALVGSLCTAGVQAVAGAGPLTWALELDGGAVVSGQERGAELGLALEGMDAAAVLGERVRERVERVGGEGGGSSARHRSARRRSSSAAR